MVDSDYDNLDRKEFCIAERAGLIGLDEGAEHPIHLILPVPWLEYSIDASNDDVQALQLAWLRHGDISPKTLDRYTSCYIASYKHCIESQP